MSPPRRVRVRSSRYDGSFRDAFNADLLDATDRMYRIRTRAGQQIQVKGGVSYEVTAATQLLFTDRWYNVNHFHTVVSPHSNFWYANLAMPAEFDGNELRWVDLDLDVMHDVDRGIVIKDSDIFEERVRSGLYPPEIVRQVYDARDEILTLAESGTFPFDHEHQIRA